MGKRRNVADYIGKKFGRWMVVRESDTKEARGWGLAVEVVCDCGVRGIKNLTRIVTGLSKSCVQCGITDRYSKKPKRHGHPLYFIWLGMIQRCHTPDHPAFQWYGARGITVCDEWRNDFFAFVQFVESEMGPRDGRTVYRIDNDRGYEPGNVRWATMAEQNANKRRRHSMVKGRAA